MKLILLKYEIDINRQDPESTKSIGVRVGPMHKSDAHRTVSMKLIYIPSIGKSHESKTMVMIHVYLCLQIVCKS